jgi:hypothetical protein
VGRGDHISWLPPDLSTEKNREEIARAAEELDVDVGRVRSALESGYMTELEPATWAAIENTDSLEVQTIGDLKRRANSKGKKIRGVFEEYVLARVNAPVVLDLMDGRFWLVGGNTRLSVANMFDVVPQVWLACLY